jgi:hypothetical protein
MKKLILAVSISLMTAALAADLSAYLKSAITGPDIKKNNTQSWSVGKTTLGLDVRKNDTMFHLELRADKLYSVSNPVDYAFVKTVCPYDGGILIAGLQRMGIADYAHGEYATGAYRGAVQIKGVGVSLKTEIAGTPVKIGHLGNFFLLDDQDNKEAKSEIAVLAGDDQLGYGAIYTDGSGTGKKNGFSVFGQGTTMISGVNLAGSVYMDLSDDAAAARNMGSRTKAGLVLGVFADYPVMEKVSVYADYVMGADEANKGYDGTNASNLLIGAAHNINDEVTAYANYSLTTAIGGTTSTLAYFAFDVVLK